MSHTATLGATSLAQVEPVSRSVASPRLDPSAPSLRGDRYLEPDFRAAAACIADDGLVMAGRTLEICSRATGYTSTLNGRFKGGWTARYHDRPTEDLHANQMELAQSNYLSSEAPPWTYDIERAERLRMHLKSILETLSAWRPA